MLLPKNRPAPLRQRFYLLIALGIAFWIAGICASVIFKDTVMLVLSLLVFVFCFIKAGCHYMTVINSEYETVSGVCVSVSPKLLRRQKKIKITDGDGNERTLLLSKHSRIKTGVRYNFYFKSAKRISLDNDYFDALLSADCFLGYEEAENCSDEHTKE